MQANKVAVIVPAAGQGTRLGGDQKQFRLLGGKPLLIRSLEVFQLHPRVDIIVVAVPKGEEASVYDALMAEELDKVVAVVAGGSSRQGSVHQGLLALPDEAGIVLVHDGVRPFVSRGQVSQIIDVVSEAGAAALAVPVADTLRTGQSGTFGETRSRKDLFRMQTPQACRRDWFLKAHQYALSSGIEATDDVDLFQQAGYEVKIVEGSSLNFKITTRADWELACIIWPAWETR